MIWLLLAATPAAARPAAAIGQICDTPERIVVVDVRSRGEPVIGARESTQSLAGTVTVISRTNGRRTTASIDATSVDTDTCGGTGGGHAGCSESGGSTIESSALAGDVLHLGHFRSFQLFHGDTSRTCRDSDSDPWIATCSTASFFAVAARGEGGAPRLRIYRGSGVGSGPQSPSLDEPATRTPGGRLASAHAALLVVGGNGMVEVDGRSEPCLALHVETE